MKDQPLAWQAQSTNGLLLFLILTFTATYSVCAWVGFNGGLATAGLLGPAIMFIPAIIAIFVQKFVLKKPIFGKYGLGLRFGRLWVTILFGIGFLLLISSIYIVTLIVFPETYRPLETISMFDGTDIGASSPEVQFAVVLLINAILGTIMLLPMFLGEELG